MHLHTYVATESGSTYLPGTKARLFVIEGKPCLPWICRVQLFRLMGRSEPYSTEIYQFNTLASYHSILYCVVPLIHGRRQSRQAAVCAACAVLNTRDNWLSGAQRSGSTHSLDVFERPRKSLLVVWPNLAPSNNDADQNAMRGREGRAVSLPELLSVRPPEYNLSTAVPVRDDYTYVLI